MSFFDIAPRWTSGGLLGAVRRRSIWMEVLGAVLIALGFLCLLSVVAASVATVYLLGGFLMAAGVMYVASTLSYWRSRSGGFVLGIILGGLCLLSGILCMTRPGQTLEALTFILGIYFITSGIARGVVMLAHRFPGWGWGLAAAGFDLVLGFLILWGWPFTGLVIPGTLLGIELITSGTSALSLGMEIRRMISPFEGEPAPHAGERPATRFQH